MKTINYIKTTNMDNMKTIRKYQEPIAYMVDDAIDSYFNSTGLTRTDHHIWVERYLLADIRIVLSYKDDTKRTNVEAKVQQLDTTKAYRIEIVKDNENVFVTTLSFDEGKSLDGGYRKYASDTELAKDFKNLVDNWLKNL